MQILIVDDDDFALDILQMTLDRMGYTSVAAHDGAEALEILRRGDIRLVITDWDMPVMNGLELCRAIRGEDLNGYVYVVMLTAREGAKQRIEGLCSGADDFLNKPLDPDEISICLKTSERILALETRDLALFALAKLAESRDAETGAHVERVQAYARLIARHLSPEAKAFNNIDDEFIRILYQTSPLHDLGKVGLPDSILLKPGKLTSDEMAVMRTHTLLGANTLSSALERFPSTRFLQIAREIALSHHERFDGGGYPHGLVGQQIPIAGRIVAVADVYDAITSRRVYKEAASHEEAMAIIERESGGQFDPDCVAAFVRAEKRIVEVRSRLRDADSEPRPTAPALADAASAATPCLDSNCKILLVEDDALLMEKLMALLSATGETVLPARTGEEALKIWQEHAPRVIVSDWMMPGMDGVELCRHIRGFSSAIPSHFIMLTVHSNKARLLEAYQAGVDDFVSKPFDPEELLARVRAGIRNAKLHDELMARAIGSQETSAQLATVNSRLEQLSITDELTGVFNRRHAMVRLDEQWQLADRFGRPLSIAMIDIDHFKRTNDTLGHAAGDAILIAVANLLREQTRGTDAVCRVGGEEFLMVFPSQTTREATICAERCRAAIASRKFDVGVTSIGVTISIGVAMREKAMTQISDLLSAADQALYAAKHGGRNQVCIATDNAALPTAPPTERQAAEPDRAPIDRQEVLLRCGGDEKFAAAVMDKFRQQSPREVGKIADALRAADASALARAAHTLKSMAAYVSADAAAGSASRIEDLARVGNLTDVERELVLLTAEVDRAVRCLADPAYGNADAANARVA